MLAKESAAHKEWYVSDASSSIRNKTKLSDPTNSSQHQAGSLNFCCNANKRQKERQQKDCISIYASMVIYVEKPQKSAKHSIRTKNSIEQGWEI